MMRGIHTPHTTIWMREREERRETDREREIEIEREGGREKKQLWM